MNNGCLAYSGHLCDELYLVFARWSFIITLNSCHHPPPPPFFPNCLWSINKSAKRLIKKIIWLLWSMFYPSLPSKHTDSVIEWARLFACTIASTQTYSIQHINYDAWLWQLIGCNPTCSCIYPQAMLTRQPQWLLTIWDRTVTMKIITLKHCLQHDRFKGSTAMYKHGEGYFGVILWRLLSLAGYKPRISPE